MVILATNIVDETLNDELILKSFEISKKYDGNSDISEIILLKPIPHEKLWELKNDIPIKEYPIAMDNEPSKIYEEIANVLDPLFDKKDYIQIIVDSSIFGFHILDVMKKFNVEEVFIIKNGAIDKFLTCICNIE